MAEWINPEVEDLVREATKRDRFAERLSCDGHGAMGTSDNVA